MIVVADAGPLIHLAGIGQLELIHRLPAEVLVPRAVFDEVVVVGAGLPGAAERQGRLTAEAMGVAVVGSIGILIAAKARGDLPALAPLLQALRASGLWLSDALIARVLLAVGERPDG